MAMQTDLFLYYYCAKLRRHVLLTLHAASTTIEGLAAFSNYAEIKT